jgi:FHA domain
MATCPNGHDSASDDFCDTCGMRIAGSPSSGLTGGTGGSPAGRPASGPTPGPGAAGGGEPCPRCGTPRVGQFCEACGYKFGAAQPPWASASAAAPRPSRLSSPSHPVSAPWPPAPPIPLAPSVTSAPSVPSVPTAPPVSAARPMPPSSYAPPAWTAVVSSDRAYHESVQAAGGPDTAVVPFPGYYAERRFRLAGSQMRIGRRSVSRGIDPEIDLTGPPADPGISRLHAVLIAAPDGGWAVLDPGSANGTLVNGTEIPTGVQVPLHDGDRINIGGWTAITVHRG